MGSSRRLVIVAQDQRLASVVQSHLHRAIQVTAPIVRYEDVPNLLTPETDGDLLLLASDPADASAVETVVRETKVQHLPAGLSVLETDVVRASGKLDPLNPYIAERFVWPHHPRELTAWAHRALAPGTPFADPATESVAETIRRRLINHTPSLTAMVEQLCIASAHDVTVLIEGETGTGKTFLAKLVHDCSERRANRFLVVSCGTLSGNLIASEFFGHAKGAFTSADAVKVGKFAAAGEGTILLDEIDTLGLEHQANLLRVIETGEFEPVGSNETQLCRARIVAATNWNLADAVERGTFRRDLYYRLHVLSFQLPALRYRPEDIGPLVRGMVAKYGTKYSKRLFSVCPEALRALEAFPWPGNIRQLENVVQQAVLTSAGNELKVHHLSPQVFSRTDAPTVMMPLPTGFDGTLKQTREATERANILRALEKANQSRTRAAQMLGVSRVTLYKKMRAYNLLKKDAPVTYPFDEFNQRAGNA
ncbi:fis family transcriptional regulator : Sigma-54 factor interaction domain-containing protein OS=Planctomyces limnophilus (strain ATCC 43296 / DSM 3776 / IFAM 1008 / 290) GN=Plim_0139 PE=4 SV=1: Sigma54_activat: HTH_8 [Gemmata massiliana]|uniref:Sigma-54 factor interaction domain-containing protein n=1 Tax=Gemmata massiliana TaxID=1210884 RepID=A0A6P2DE04_9BACT|nr:sigma 54-interacting transcriptional regulator [Gemmata massiliana]VTS00050.1 fis family transcriptional regulator : Sigma-54 factor interaction domain-containing protein OS=Planctomyces limnophilus (strain ATCC 43296 / DSM 3776 / IFAM 1008 / 290) GN=Plim_0139 PE=4 SV=1: Sigma54_activat: HTH_8 [Gemmata massiliana]